MVFIRDKEKRRALTQKNDRDPLKERNQTQPAIFMLVA